jgi:hypothetical protein
MMLYSIECMARLYDVEIEPEVRAWLVGLSDRDFGEGYLLARPGAAGDLTDGVPQDP